MNGIFFFAFGDGTAIANVGASQITTQMNLLNLGTAPIFAIPKKALTFDK